MILDEGQIRNNEVLRVSLNFSLQILNYAEEINLKRRWVVANQLTRCGTSVGANIFEAQNAESKADFIHKMKIAAKELDESVYWMFICRSAKDYPDVSELMATAQSLGRLIGKIISTSKGSLT